MNDKERAILHTKLESIFPNYTWPGDYVGCPICDAIEESESEATKLLIEEAEYHVTFTLTTIIPFSSIPRDKPLCVDDAIANAESTMRPEFWASLEDEGWHIDQRAVKLT